METRETTLRGKWGFPCGLIGSRLALFWIICHKFLYFTFNFAMIIIFPSKIFFYDPVYVCMQILWFIQAGIEVTSLIRGDVNILVSSFKS